MFISQHRIVEELPYPVGMDGFGDRVRIEREGKGWSQVRLAEEVTRLGFKIGQSAIGNMEKKAETNPKCIHELARALGVTVPWLRTGRGTKAAPAQSSVQIFEIDAIEKAKSGSDNKSTAILWRASIADGFVPGVFMINAHKGRVIERPAYLSGEDKSFSFKVIGKENEPVYRVRDRLWVNPDEPLEQGEDCLFVQEPIKLEGGPAIVARLVRITDRAWIVKQHALDEEQSLLRREWRHAWVIVGRERRR